MQAGNVLIDGLGVGDVGNIVLRDRKMLSQDGILVVVVTLGKDEKKIISGPEIISRGFVYVRESEALIDRSTEIVRMIVEQSIKEYSIEWSMLKQNIRELLGQFLYEETKRKPMILPIIMEYKKSPLRVIFSFTLSNEIYNLRNTNYIRVKGMRYDRT